VRINIWHFIVPSKRSISKGLICLMPHADQPLRKAPRRVLSSWVCALLFQQCVFAEDNLIEVIRLQNRSAGEVQGLLTPLLEPGEALTGNGFDLILKSRPERLETIRGLIQQLDSRQHDLIISVLNNSIKSAEQLNAEVAIQASSQVVRMQGMTGNTRDSDNHRSMQQLRTLEGQPAHIQASTTRPIENVTVYDFGYGYPGVASSPHMQQAGSGFAAIPRLIGNQDVIIDIAPWSDRFLNRASIETQAIQSTIRARLGEWVQLGGTIQTQQSERHGFSGLNHSTRNQDTYTLIKIDLAD
jgi:type II secretory pathway component GspD/PulD (secretin)